MLNVGCNVPLQTIPALVRLIARVMTTGSLELTRQCIEVLSFKFQSRSPKALSTTGVNRSALSNLAQDRLLFETVCVPRLRSLQDTHWNESIKDAAGRALAGLRAMTPVTCPMYPPLPESPERA